MVSCYHVLNSVNHFESLEYTYPVICSPLSNKCFVTFEKIKKEEHTMMDGWYINAALTMCGSIINNWPTARLDQ